MDAKARDLALLTAMSLLCAGVAWISDYVIFGFGLFCSKARAFLIGHSAGATTRERCFSTPLTSTAITAVAKTKPSAMVAVVPSTRSKPPRP